VARLPTKQKKQNLSESAWESFKNAASPWPFEFPEFRSGPARDHQQFFNCAISTTVHFSAGHSFVVQRDPPISGLPAQLLALGSSTTVTFRWQHRAPMRLYQSLLPPCCSSMLPHRLERQRRPRAIQRAGPSTCATRGAEAALRTALVPCSPAPAAKRARHHSLPATLNPFTSSTIASAAGHPFSPGGGRRV